MVLSLEWNIEIYGIKRKSHVSPGFQGSMLNLGKGKYIE